jgi:hypothetical protein
MKILPKFYCALSVLLVAASRSSSAMSVVPEQNSQHKAPASPNLKAEWITRPAKGNVGSKPKVPTPARSGHVAFKSGESVFLFGGYGEEILQGGPANRSPMNDLWKCASNDGSCERLDQKNPPEERLVSAISVLNGKPYLFGGWNPNNRDGAENEILDTIHSLDLGSYEWTDLPTRIPDGPTSRHVTLVLPCKSRALLHNHRCVDHIYVFDQEKESFTKQKTSGNAPSSRGLHAACMMGSFALFFGGADKMQGMSNEAFLLDTITWEWTEVTFEETEDSPVARAAPCLVSFNESCALLYGGAKVGDKGLDPLDDLWALAVNKYSGEGKWILLASSEKEDQPPGRNAATLTEINAPVDDDDKKAKYFALHGGWAPFRQTWNDAFILRISSSQ